MSLTPRVDDYTDAIIEHAVESLTNLRGLPCPDDPGVRLHILASLGRQIDITVTGTVIAARRHDYRADEIAELLGSAVTTRLHRGPKEAPDEITQPSSEADVTSQAKRSR